MNTRLSFIDLDLNNIIKKYKPEEQRKAVQAVVELVVSHIKIDERVLLTCADYIIKQKTIPNNLMGKFRILVEDLDNEYLTISDKFDKGKTTEDDVARAFSVARIGSALLWATDTNPYVALIEMIYEINAGLENLDELKKVIMQSVN